MRFTNFLLTALTALVFAAPANATPITLFDNGSVDASRTTWNNTSSYSIVDDLVLGSASTITGLVYHIFTNSPLAYTGTNVSLFNGAINSSGTTGSLITSFTAVGALTSNGLHSNNSSVYDGFDISITGLSIDLDPGTYSLQFLTSSALSSIGSGAGSAQTIGSGLYQVGGGFRTNDHMAFTVLGNENDVPEPGSMALLGLGLAGLAYSHKRKAQSTAA